MTITKRDILSAGIGTAVGIAIGWFGRVAYEKYFMEEKLELEVVKGGEENAVESDETEETQETVYPWGDTHPMEKPSLRVIQKQMELEEDKKEAEYIAAESGYICFDQDFNAEIVSLNDFLEDEKYAKEGWAYDEELGTMYDEDGQDVEWRNIIPESFLEHFGYLSEDSEIVYVRSHQTRCIYEIARCGLRE